MGFSMCQHVLRAGYQVTVHTRTRSKAAPLLAQGALWADTPAQVARQSDVIVSIVGFPEQVRGIVLGEDGLLANASAGSVLVDMTTSRPALAREIAEAAEARRVFSLDAPVSGGDVGARQARLSIMVGGERAVFEALEPFWKTLGHKYVHQGPAGSGQHTKLVNQILVAGGMVGVCEALLYAHKAGLDLQSVLESVCSGAAGSWSLTNYAPRIITGDFEPGFLVEHFIKDMGIALDEARRLELSLPGLALAQQLYLALQAQGHGKAGVHSLQLALAALSGVDWQERSGASD